MKIQLRYNHDSKHEHDKWRLLIDDQEQVVSEVIFECNTKTTCDLVESNGQVVEKFHITAIDACEVVFYYGGDNFVRSIILNKHD
jgi:hypothetical protein